MPKNQYNQEWEQRIKRNPKAQSEFLSQGKETRIKRRSLAFFLVRYFGLLPVLLLGAYFLASSLLIVLLGAFFTFIVAYDVWWVRLRVHSEPYKSQKHEYWDDVSMKRFGIAILSFLLTLLVLIPLIVSIPYFLLFSLAAGIAIAWSMLRITRRARVTPDPV